MAKNKEKSPVRVLKNIIAKKTGKAKDKAIDVTSDVLSFPSVAFHNIKGSKADRDRNLLERSRKAEGASMFSGTGKNKKITPAFKIRQVGENRRKELLKKLRKKKENK